MNTSKAISKAVSPFIGNYALRRPVVTFTIKQFWNDEAKAFAQCSSSISSFRSCSFYIISSTSQAELLLCKCLAQQILPCIANRNMELSLCGIVVFLVVRRDGSA